MRTVTGGPRTRDAVTTTASAIAMGAGLCGAVQPEINSELGTRLGSSLVASCVNFSVALLVALLVLSRRRGTRVRLGDIRAWPVPRWTFAAGLGGVTVVLAGVITVEELGVAIFSIAFFAGQMSGGLLVDWLGITPGGRRPITASRVGAAASAVGAVVLSQVGQPSGDLALGAVAFVVASGVASAFQSAFNGRISGSVGDPFAATFVNVTVGTACLAVILGVTTASGSLERLTWPGEVWLYAGGVFGVTVVLSLAAASAAIGVLRTTVAMLAAQLVGAFGVDWAVRDDAPTVAALVGAIVILGAVLLVNRGARAPVAATL